MKTLFAMIAFMMAISMTAHARYNDVHFGKTDDSRFTAKTERQFRVLPCGKIEFLKRDHSDLFAETAVGYAGKAKAYDPSGKR